jgi:hypothetical protein
MNMVKFILNLRRISLVCLLGTVVYAGNHKVMESDLVEKMKTKFDLSKIECDPVEKTKTKLYLSEYAHKPLQKSDYAGLQKTINRIVSETSIKRYGDINRNWTYPETNQPLSTESKVWKATYYEAPILENGKKKIIKTPVVVNREKEFVDLGQSIRNLIQSPSILECTIALSAVKILCLEKIMGKYFNSYWHAFQKITSHLNWKKETFFHELCLPLMTLVNGKEAPAGTITYLTNVFRYLDFKPGGITRGDNLVKVTETDHIGFGEFYKDGAKKSELIEEQFFKSFCDLEDVEVDTKKHTLICNIYNGDKTIFKTERQKDQKKIQSYDFFDVKKIMRFINRGEIEIAGELYYLKSSKVKKI